MKFKQYLNNPKFKQKKKVKDLKESAKENKKKYHKTIGRDKFKRIFTEKEICEALDSLLRVSTY